MVLSLWRFMIAGFAAFGAMSAFTQEPYPSRTVMVVVPWPSGPTDLLGRLTAQKMSALWGKPVVVENRPGAAGTVGTEVLVRSAPDGYKLLLTASQPIVIGPALFRTPYEPTKDLVPVAVFGEEMDVLVVAPSSNVKSMAELIALAKAKPGALTFSSSGQGSLGHLCGEMIKQVAGIDMLHVPYQGVPPALTAVLTGEVTLSCSAVQQIVPHIKAGKLISLGVTAMRPPRYMPELQPLSAQGFKDLDVTVWYGVFAPPKTPRQVVQILRDTLQKVFQDPGMRQKLDDAGFERIWEADDDLIALRIKTDLAKYRKVVEAARIAPN